MKFLSFLVLPLAISLDPAPFSTPGPAFCSIVKYCNPGDGSTNNVSTVDVSGCDLSVPIALTLNFVSGAGYGYCLIGNGKNVIKQPPGSKGDLCITGGSCLGRYAKDVFATIGNGSATFFIDDTISGGPDYGIPTCGGNIQPGETWGFQFWFRQAMGQPSAMSEAIRVTFE